MSALHVSKKEGKRRGKNGIGPRMKYFAELTLLSETMKVQKLAIAVKINKIILFLQLKRAFGVSEFQKEGLVRLSINFGVRRFGRNFSDSVIGLVVFTKK